jgi:hypothetical protein
MKNPAGKMARLAGFPTSWRRLSKLYGPMVIRVITGLRSKKREQADLQRRLFALKTFLIRVRNELPESVHERPGWHRRAGDT